MTPAPHWLLVAFAIGLPILAVVAWIEWREDAPLKGPGEDDEP